MINESWGGFFFLRVTPNSRMLVYLKWNQDLGDCGWAFGISAPHFMNLSLFWACVQMILVNWCGQAKTGWFAKGGEKVNGKKVPFNRSLSSCHFRWRLPGKLWFGELFADWANYIRNTQQQHLFHPFDPCLNISFPSFFWIITLHTQNLWDLFQSFNVWLFSLLAYRKGDGNFAQKLTIEWLKDSARALELNSNTKLAIREHGFGSREKLLRLSMALYIFPGDN